MFSDIEGYSSLMNTNEASGLRQLNINSEAHASFSSRFNGRVVKEIGDGILTVFETTSAAVQCALEIQKVAIQHNISLRIGLHMGEVILKKDDVLGDGVNIASRVENLGTPGSIVMTKKVRDEIENKGYSTKFIGKFKVKNINRDIFVYSLDDPSLTPHFSINKSGEVNQISFRQWALYLSIVLLSLISFLVYWNQESFLFKSDPEPALARIAVLPFKFHGQEEHSHLENGIVDLISNKISGTEGLTAIDPNLLYSHFLKKDTDYSAMIGSNTFKNLKVKYTISGSIIQTGSSFQLSSNLVDNNSNKLVRNTQYNCQNIDSLFDQIDLIVLNLIKDIADSEGLEILMHGVKTTDNYEALNEYLKGENERRLGRIRSADQYYRNAITLDSTYVMAWARWLSNSTWILNTGWEQITALEKLSDLNGLLTPSFNDYLTSYKLLTQGRPIEAIDLLEQSMIIHGRDADKISLLSEIYYHQSILLEESYFSAEPLSDELIELNLLKYEALSHKVSFVQRRGEYDEMKEVINELADYSSTYYDYSNILPYLCDQIEYGFQSIPIDTFINRKEDPLVHFILFNKGHEYPDYVKKEIEPKVSSSDQTFKEHHYYYLILSGRYIEAISLYPDIYYNKGSWFIFAYFLMERNFQPMSPLLASSTLDFILNKDKSFNNDHTWQKAARGVFEVMAGNRENVLQILEELDGHIEVFEKQLADEVISPFRFEMLKSVIIYHSLRIQYYNSRLNHEDGSEKILLDSLFSNYLQWPNYAFTETLYVNLKFSKVETLYGEARYEEALELLTILINRDASGLELPVFHAPFRFRMATLYDELGEYQKADSLYQYFLAIYENCDPFYQSNVDHARKRINELEEINPFR